MERLSLSGQRLHLSRRRCHANPGQNGHEHLPRSVPDGKIDAIGHDWILRRRLFAKFDIGQ